MVDEGHVPQTTTGGFGDPVLTAEVYRGILEAAPDAIVVVNPGGGIVFVNASAEDLFGCRRQDLIGSSVDVLLPERFRARHGALRADFSVHLPTWPMGSGRRLVARRRDGSEFPAEISLSPLQTVSGTLVVSAIRDLTERLALEEAAREREAMERIRQVVSAAPTLIYSLEVDADSVLGVNWMSPNLSRLTGWDADASLSVDWWFAHVHPDDVHVTMDALSELLAQDTSQREYRFSCRDGRLIWVRDHWRVLRDGAGRPTEVVGAWTDITAAKEAQARASIVDSLRLRMREMDDPQEIYPVLSAMGDALRELGLAFVDCGVNLLDADTPGMRSHSLDATGDWEVATNDRAATALHRVLGGGVPCYRRDLDRDDPLGEREDLRRALGHPVRSVLDVPFSHGTLAINSDLPDAFTPEDVDLMCQLADVLSGGFRRLDDLEAVRRAEGQLRQAQRLESVGRLAGGVAHDFNNLLTVILGHCQFLLRPSRRLDETAAESVRQVQEAGQHGVELVRQLLAFSRKQVLRPEVLDVDNVVVDLRKMLGRLLGEDVEFVHRPAGQPVRVLVDRGQLTQVLMNLAVNARDAMPNGGQLHVCTSAVELDARYAAQHEGAVPGPYALLEVSDTGVGMDAETRASIFEPFFTTKQDEGTGLGLATVYGIVKQSGGSIWVYSEPGMGTLFRIYLPLVGSAGEGAEALAPRPPAAGGTETILLVEDEHAVRQVVAIALREEGYRVLEAASGAQALAIAVDDPPQLVLTDIVMRGMSGLDLWPRLAPARAGMKAVFMSGYSEDIVQRQGVMPPGTAFVQKPLDFDILLRRIRELLDGA